MHLYSQATCAQRNTEKSQATAGACGLTAEGQDGHASPPELQDPSPATAGSLLVVGTAPAAVTAHASNGSRGVVTMMGGLVLRKEGLNWVRRRASLTSRNLHRKKLDAGWRSAENSKVVG